MRLYMLPVILIVCGTALSAVAEWSVPVKRLEIAAQVDFDALHQQAAMALDTLRQSRTHRMASASTAAF